jgi:hypothetical protein
MLNFTSIIESSSNKLWGCHFAVPETIAAFFLESGSQRVVCTLNDIHEYQCALSPYGEGRRVITVNKATQKKLGLHFGATVQVSLKKDESEYGLPMPEEMQEVLNLDSEGNEHFQALTDGKKRTLLYIAAKPKNSDTRIRYALAVVEHLKKQGGKIDFKILNLDLKNAR